MYNIRIGRGRHSKWSTSRDGRNMMPVIWFISMTDFLKDIFQKFWKFLEIFRKIWIWWISCRMWSLISAWCHSRLHSRLATSACQTLNRPNLCKQFQTLVKTFFNNSNLKDSILGLGQKFWARISGHVIQLLRGYQLICKLRPKTWLENRKLMNYSPSLIERNMNLIYSEAYSIIKNMVRILFDVCIINLIFIILK